MTLVNPPIDWDAPLELVADGTPVYVSYSKGKDDVQLKRTDGKMFHPTQTGYKKPAVTFWVWRDGHFITSGERYAVKAVRNVAQ